MFLWCYFVFNALVSTFPTALTTVIALASLYQLQISVFGFDCMFKGLRLTLAVINSAHTVISS